MCDKCGRKVPISNDATLFTGILTGEPIIMLFAYGRHLLPIIEDGKVVCEGSPSRAQYIAGQPRDPRPEYAYEPKLEWVYRMVYEVMQLVAANMMAGVN